jgi:hypothetical protein
LFDFSEKCEYNVFSSFMEYFANTILKKGGRPMVTVVLVFAGVRGQLPHNSIGKVRPLAFRP